MGGSFRSSSFHRIRIRNLCQASTACHLAKVGSGMFNSAIQKTPAKDGYRGHSCLKGLFRNVPIVMKKSEPILGARFR